MGDPTQLKQLRELQREAQDIRASAGMIRARMQQDFRKSSPAELDALSHKLERWREERLSEIERSIRELKEDLEFETGCELKDAVPPHLRSRPATPMPTVATRVLTLDDCDEADALPPAVREVLEKGRHAQGMSVAQKQKLKLADEECEPLKPKDTQYGSCSL